MREIFNILGTTINENANTNNMSPSGQMMQVAIKESQQYALNELISPRFKDLHMAGYIHIHDLDFYPTKTATCLQYDISKLFTGGFATKNGAIKEPRSIETYATLATIVFQTNQNEQHGGQAIPAFDFFMAPGVLKSFMKNFIKIYRNFCQLSNAIVDENVINIVNSLNTINRDIFVDLDLVNFYDIALEKTDNDTYQAMQGFIFNLNSMHSRGGNQVVFSSINYGTDTSFEGRMVIKNILKATRDGLGKNEVCVFPIQIFKVKEGVNYSNIDINKVLNTIEFDLIKDFDAPNFDLLIEAVRTNTTNLYPNFVFLDTEFNHNDAWDPKDPKRYLNEVATMGCRTRVYENINGSKTSVGRGNLSFTSLNIVRLAIEANKNVEVFYQSVRDLSIIICEQLKERYDYQISALQQQFGFMLSNKLWDFKGEYNPLDPVGDIFNSGTLGLGFIGGHNAMMALFGQGHDLSQAALDCLTKTLEILNEVCSEFKEKYHLNYSVLATPAEGLSGRFVGLDRRDFGSIAGVTDKDYYVNSFHVNVASDVSIGEKIKIEAPFHKLTLGGHITYVEVDGNTINNPQAVLSIVKLMFDSKIGYGSINHPLDYCQECGFKGYIDLSCPICNSKDIVKVRRITGYLTANIDNWNHAKRAELDDRKLHRS